MRPMAAKGIPLAPINDPMTTVFQSSEHLPEQPPCREEDDGEEHHEQANALIESGGIDRKGWQRHGCA